jgi:hypothetical protein
MSAILRGIAKPENVNKKGKEKRRLLGCIRVVIGVPKRFQRALLLE